MEACMKIFYQTVHTKTSGRLITKREECICKYYIQMEDEIRWYFGTNAPLDFWEEYF
eukprot:TRINITY_DN4761_c0_g1_i1.p2 TRINITY_DN4761_c0_g1~~TRINITY_DN4761_c0_g1_i1.p2  ORF type:complete len:57 (+),score=5.81 TRINITY_DN4761_c0_g1_i1:377-547(+)